jgi:hypothetical protein
LVLATNSDYQPGSGSGGGDIGLSPATLAKLRNVLARQFQHPEQRLDDEVKAVLERVAGEARNRHIKAEQLVLIFKNIWSSLPDSPRAADSEAQTALRHHLITLCIKAYYSK